MEEGTDRTWIYRAGQLSPTKCLKIAGGLKCGQAPLEVKLTQFMNLFVERRVYCCGTDLNV